MTRFCMDCEAELGEKMICCVCGTVGDDVKSYFVTGRFMNDRILDYCKSCADRVAKMLPHIFNGPEIKLREREFFVLRSGAELALFWPGD